MQLYLAGGTSTIRPIMPRLLIVNCTADSLLQKLAAWAAVPTTRCSSSRCAASAGRAVAGDLHAQHRRRRGPAAGRAARRFRRRLDLRLAAQCLSARAADGARAARSGARDLGGRRAGLRLVLGAAAHDGRAGRHGHLNPNGREIGVARRIAPTDAGRRHALFDGKSGPFDALCSHEDEVETLPAGAELLASNAVSRVQAMAIREGEKSFWGVQYHPEFDFGSVAAIIALRAQRHLDEGLAGRRARSTRSSRTSAPRAGRRAQGSRLEVRPARRRARSQGQRRRIRQLAPGRGAAARGMSVDAKTKNFVENSRSSSSVILSAAKDLTERSGTGRVAGVRSFAALRTTREE